MKSIWQKVFIADVCHVESGAGFPLDYQGRKGDTFPLFKVGDMNTPGNEREMIVYQHSISEQVRDKLNAYVFPAGSIIFPKIGAAIETNKKRLINRPSCVDNNVIGIIPSEKVATDFLYLLLLQKDLMEFANPGNPPSIRKTTIEEWEIPLPPLAEQQRIAAILRKADRVRRLRRYGRALSESVLQGVFLEMFGNQERYPTVLVKEVLIEDPKNGLYLPAELYGSGTPIIRIDAFYNGFLGDVRNLKRVRASKQQVRDFSVDNGDILINRVNSLEYLGKCAFVENIVEPTVYESNMMRIRTKKDYVLPEYFARFLSSRSAYQQIRALAKEAVNQASINQQDVKSLTVNLRT